MKFASISILAFAFCAAASAEPLTVHQLMRSPDRYADQTVRVTGQVDNCIARSCSLCPAEMTRETFDAHDCFNLSFDGFPDRDGNDARAQMDAAFRFATVILEAHFDPGCIERGSCVDREGGLSDARVMQVIARKPAAEGLVSWYREGRLLDPGPEDRRLMTAEWDKLAGRPDTGLKLFIVEDYSLQHGNMREVGLGCVCYAQSCDGTWPAHYFGGFNAPGNPYRCYEMAKFADGWELLPD
jgi:hypothetical protein